MNFNKKLRWGKLVWCLFLFIYFFHFFKNLFFSSVSQNQLIPIIFFVILSYWMIIEYYFSSPFFQSGIGEYHKVLKTVYSLYFYPFLVFNSVDYCYKNLFQITFLKPIINILGLLFFLSGTVLRVITLLIALDSSLNNLSQKIIYKKIRQPRYLATLIQLVGISFTFSSFIGLLLLLIGIWIIIAEAKYEDKQLKKYYKDSKTFLLIPKVI